MEIGQMAVKIAGRDSDQLCLILNIIDENFVLIDGNVRRKKCNIKHLEILDKTLEINKNASSEMVVKALEMEKIKVLKKGKERTRKERPRKIKKSKEKQKTKKEVDKKEEKKNTK
jgi:large subunit ribosomal protein L14e